GGYRVIIINRAHCMNHNAANSLLKTLEEPSQNTLFILLSHHAERLQPTIISRCQKVMMHQPDHSLALNWLKMQLPADRSFTDEMVEIALTIAENAPVKALEILSDETLSDRQRLYQGLVSLSQGQADPLQFAAEWHERHLQTTFQLLFYW